MTSISIAIIGAGISGLVCARNLLNRFQSINISNQQLNVTLFDKAAKAGGRLSTRKGTQVAGGKFQFDHGAQYFTARDPVFQTALNQWITDGVAAEWKSPIKVVDASNHQITDTSANNPRYVGVDGMNSIAQHLAKGLDIKLNTRIASISHSSKWTLTSDKNEAFNDFDIVVVSIPCPQSETLLTEKFLSEIGWKSKLEQVKMEPCWSLMLGLENKVNVNYDGAFVHNSPLSWIARNSSKPGRSDSAEAWVLHASPEWSAQHFNDTQAEVMEKLKQAFKEATEVKELKVEAEMIHRWAYASVPNSLQDKYLFDGSKGIALCGDWLNGSRVEGAYMSGYYLSNRIFEHLYSNVKSQL